MRATLRIDRLQSNRSTVFCVEEILPSGDGGMIGEFTSEREAIHFARSYAVRNGYDLQTAEVIPFRKRVA